MYKQFNDLKLFDRFYKELELRVLFQAFGIIEF